MSRQPGRPALAINALAVLAVLLLAVPAAGATPPLTGQPVTVSGPSPFIGCTADDPATYTANSETEPWAAVNPTDHDNVVTIWQQDRNAAGSSRGIVAGVSRDGGRSWSTVVLPGMSACTGGSGRVSNPWIHFASSGELYASATVTGAVSAILISRSGDGGSTWSAPTALVSDPSSAFFSDKQATATDPLDPRRVYVVWNRRNLATGQHEVLLARSTDGGRAFEPPRSIYSPPAPAGTIGNQLVALRDGTLVDIFFQSDTPLERAWPGVPETIRAIRSSDRGATWSEPVTIAGIKLNLPLFPDTGTPLVAPGIVPDVAVDLNRGAVYAVWAEAGLSQSGSAVGLSASLDGGRHWSRPLRVDHTPDSPAGGNGQSFLPQVDADRDGNVAVTYYDFRDNTPEPGTPTGYWMATCPGRHARDCPLERDAWTERRLAGPFLGLEQASHSFGGPFVGTYVALANRPGRFVATFVMTTADSGNPQDVRVVQAPPEP